MKNGIKTLATWLIIGVIFIVLLSSIMTNTNTKLKYSELIAKINEGKVESIVIDADGTSATVQLSDDKIKKQVNIPNMENFMNYTDEFIKNGAFTLEESSESVLSIILGLLLVSSSAVFADDVMPAQTANDNRAVVTVQKQPAKENKQQVKNNWFCIVIQVNGKINDTDSSNK